MDGNQAFYLCPTCFEATEELNLRHPHKMLRVDPAQLDDEQRESIMDKSGRPITRAPRWFLQAIGSYRSARAYGPSVALGRNLCATL